MMWYVKCGSELFEAIRDDKSVSEDGRRGLDEADIWTVSQNPTKPGWDTDTGDCSGYGLTRTAAQFLVDAANEKEARDGPFVDPYGAARR